LLELEGVEERANQKSQISYRTTKSFAAIDPKKTFLQCQFKGPETIDDPKGRAKDIRNFNWGYQWIVKVEDHEDIEYAFKLLRDAYEREQ
jgi:predicted transport protein